MLRKRSLFFGLIVPLALLAGQLSTLAHTMAVAHDRCPEHGELVHRAAGPTRVAAGADTVFERAPSTAVLAVTSVVGHAHEHCISFWGRRELCGAPPRPSVELAPPPATAALPNDAPAHGGRNVLLSFAPKTSPPHAA